VNPDKLKFTKTHEWVAIAEKNGEQVATVGISAHAVEALTDLVFIELPKTGRKVTALEPFCEVESVKAVSDIYAPVSGEVVAVNQTLAENLEILSNDPYGAGWIAQIRIDDASDLADLMDHATYQKQVAEEAQ
jgi:glycine cleavage system H protein